MKLKEQKIKNKELKFILQNKIIKNIFNKMISINV